MMLLLLHLLQSHITASDRSIARNRIIIQPCLHIMMLRMEIGMLRSGIILVLLLNFAVDILERITNEHRSVQRLFGRLPEPRQLVHRQIAHFEASLAIALLIVIAPDAIAAVAASFQLTRIGAHVIAAAQLQVRFAIFGAAYRLLFAGHL